MTLIEKEWKAKQKFIGKSIRLYRGDFDADQQFFTCMDIKCIGQPSGWNVDFVFYDENHNKALMWNKLRDIQIESEAKKQCQKK